MDRLIENDDWLDMYEQCLGTQDLSYCNGHLFLRSGPTDKRHAEHPWQGYHIDNATNNFLPTHRETSLYHYVNSSIYLHDVPDDCAPMQIIPGSHRQIMDLLPKLIRDGNWIGRGGIKDIRKVPEFAAPVPVRERLEVFASIVLLGYMLRSLLKINEGREDIRRSHFLERIPVNG